MGFISQHAYDPGIRGTDGENVFLFVRVHLDPLDHPAFPLRPVDEPGMEEVNSVGFDKYDYHCSGCFVAEEVNGECIYSLLTIDYSLTIFANLKNQL